MVSLKRSAFEPKAGSRPSKRARASSADGDVRDAAANIDKDPATPRRDPRPDLQRPSTTDLPTRPHAVLDDSEQPRPEGQYHPGIVPNSDETSSIRSTSSGRDNDPHTDESVFDDRDDMPSIADRRNLVSNAAAAFVIIPQSPRVAVLDEGNTPEDTGFDQGYEAASTASWDVVALYDSENLDRQPEVQYQPTNAEDELTESYETKSTGSTSVTSAAGWDVVTLYDSENLDRQPEDQYHPTDAEGELEEDESELTEGYETGSTGSSSITPSVYDDNTFENGRRYRNFKNGCYPIPNDREELIREDMKHYMLMQLCDGQLFYAPIGDLPHMILDIGTGSGELYKSSSHISSQCPDKLCDPPGVWAIEVGDQYPTARVRGIDQSPTQPDWVPPNVDFLNDDVEQGEWLDRDVDFVHFRFMAIVLKDVVGVLKRAYK